MNENMKKSILDMARGGVQERVDYEMGKVVDNINDANTSPVFKRKIVLTIIMQPDVDRKNITVDYSVKSTLAPTNSVRTMLYSADENTFVEVAPQIPGQIGLDGSVQDPPAQLKLIKFA